MAAETGTKLGRYEIRAKLGEGGMGEVSLAEDVQVKRRSDRAKFVSDDVAKFSAEEKASARLLRHL